jgi:hypothetical protein
MHRRVAIALGEHREDAHGPGIVEWQDADARGAGDPPGGMRECLADPAVAVVDDDERMQWGSQADMLRKSGVTWASVSP